MSDRAYALKRNETAKQGIRRVARGRIAHAVEALRDPGADPVVAVHTARKDMKKLRATLRLVRPVVGERTYAAENQRFRDAARQLSGVRDAHVRGETVDALAERFPDDAPPGGWTAARAAVAGAHGPSDGELDWLRERVADRIAAGNRAIARWRLDANGFALLKPGLKRAYSRGRRRFREAEAGPTDERLHEFRKRSKDLWYHLRLVGETWPGPLGSAAEEAHVLSDLLGDDHDLAVLREHLAWTGSSMSRAQQRHLTGLIERRRPELQNEAFALGERLFAEKPKRFAARLRAYWEASPLP